MFGKIVQLRGVPLEDGFEVEYGVALHQDCTVDFESARISAVGISDVKKKCIYCGAYVISKLHDSFADILLPVFDEKYLNPNVDIEDYLLVIIPYSSKIETTAKKIAGRYSTEAFLEMHAGDTIKVCKVGANPETYMAVQAGNEMFLIKKNR